VTGQPTIISFQLPTINNTKTTTVLIGFKAETFLIVGACLHKVNKFCVLTIPRQAGSVCYEDHKATTWPPRKSYI
jgi:hypothetical protein